MEDRKMVEALARLDGLTGVHHDDDGVLWYQSDMVGQDGMPHLAMVPDYLHSHDAMQRIVDGLSDAEFHDYANYLAMIVHQEIIDSLDNIKDLDNLDWDHTLKATPRQKAEAVPKAKGLWEGESDDR